MPEDRAIDDIEAKELEAKVEQTLKDIAKLSATFPEELNKWLATASEKDKKDFGQMLPQIVKALPDISTVWGNWTESLSAYANYRILKRQEGLSEEILRSNRLLARATVVLAIATFALVVVSVFHL